MWLILSLNRLINLSQQVNYWLYHAHLLRMVSYVLFLLQLMNKAHHFLLRASNSAYAKIGLKWEVDIWRQSYRKTCFCIVVYHFGCTVVGIIIYQLLVRLCIRAAIFAFFFNSSSFSLTRISIADSWKEKHQINSIKTSSRIIMLNEIEGKKREKILIQKLKIKLHFVSTSFKNIFLLRICIGKLIPIITTILNYNKILT